MQNLNVIGNYDELIKLLEDMHEFNIKKISVEEINDTDDVLLISDDALDINTILSIKSGRNECFYIVRNQNLATQIDKGLLDLKNIILIPIRDTAEEVKQAIARRLLKKESDNNVYTFLGCDSKLGVSSTIMSLALKLAKKHTSMEIVILNLNGKSGFEWLCGNDFKLGLPDIRIAQKNNFLNHQTIKDNCYKYFPNLYILNGDENIEESINYNSKEINELINMCQNSFDIVLIDAGNINNLNLRMTYSALKCSDNKILISDQFSETFNLFRKYKEQILDDLGMKKFKFLVLNKYVYSSVLPKKLEISNKYSLPIISILPYVDFNYRAYEEKNAALFTMDKAYNDGINNILAFIEKKNNLSSTLESKKTLFDIVWRKKI